MVFDPAENTDLWMQQLKAYQSWDPQRYLLKFPADVCTAEQAAMLPQSPAQIPDPAYRWYGLHPAGP